MKPVFVFVIALCMVKPAFTTDHNTAKKPGIIFYQENEYNKDCIIVSTPSEDEVIEKGYRNWPIWSGAAKTYPIKTYSSTEVCYFIEGEVRIITESGNVYNINAGDLVIFNKGCTCTWVVTKAAKKHYKFE